ncbi:hypothetical protein MKK69_24030 [Methylobacterium sp. J-026]|uniref:hypothetical protein n=1 Tax=Methylobacterium sp. J-026 TaxID=2836624 RepID=UPI001FB9ACA2|nr:hypothetical protein [Methylobacterium sp. J-026]MCJ2137074.1 hypothetical protein [Methylobacterium sp. J-026]
MSSDTEQHHALLSALRAAHGQGDGAFERAVTDAFAHVFAHLERLSSHVALGGPEGEDRHLNPGESPTLR